MSLNLVPGGWNRRTIQGMEELGMKYVQLPEIYDRLHTKEWPYKRTPKLYHIRDRACGALMVITCGRINEILRIIMGQFIETHMLDLYDNDPDILILSQFWVSKRKEGTRHPTPDMPLYRVGPMAPFTALVEKYLSILDKKDDKLFKFGTSRAWDIINYITGGGQGNRENGLWCQWFRAQSLSYNINLLRSATIVAKQKGIDNPSTIAHYYRGDWVATKDEMKGVKK